MAEISTLEWLSVAAKNFQTFILDTTTGRVVLGIGITYAGYKLVCHVKLSHRRAKWAEMSKDKVILHQIQRGKLTPSISPFCLKLETYLRMASIPYKVDTTPGWGPKGQIPWINVKGKEIGDSQLCIEYLGSKYEKDLSRHLTEEQKGVGVALQVMVDEHLVWGLAIWRAQVDKMACLDSIIKLSCFRKFVIKIMVPKVFKKKAIIQGIGRHSLQEVEGIVLKELRAISAILGKKKFMLSDEPCEADCAVFAELAQFMWNSPGSKYEKLFEGELRNLRDYCLRMKERFWQDWDQCLDN